MMLPKGGWHYFLMFVAAAIFIRFPTFFQSVIDHDESTYLVIANEWMKGKVLYRDLIDLKPPGIFVIFSAILAIFGKSIFWVRVVGAAVIGLTAFFIFSIKKQLGGRHLAAVLGGFLYLLFTIYHFSLGINAEHFLAFFTAFSIWLLLVAKEKPPAYLLVGMVMGSSFMVKFLALFDFLAIGAFVFWTIYEQEKNYRKTLSDFLPKAALAGVGFVTPFALTNLYFYSLGAYDAFQFITFEAPGNYVADVTLFDRILFVVNFHVVYLLFLVPFYLVLFHKSRFVTLPTKVLAVSLFVFAHMSVQTTGKMFPHYWLQFGVPVCLLAGDFVFLRSWFSSFLRNMADAKSPRRIVAVTLLLTAVFLLNYLDYFVEKDYPEEIQSYLHQRGIYHEKIYPANTYHILYFLKDQEPLTPYVHSSLMVKNGHIKTLRINVNRELERVKSQNPRFILVDKIYPIASFDNYIRSHYFLARQFGKNLYLYERC